MGQWVRAGAPGEVGSCAAINIKEKDVFASGHEITVYRTVQDLWKPAAYHNGKANAAQLRFQQEYCVPVPESSVAAQDEKCLVRNAAGEV